MTAMPDEVSMLLDPSFLAGVGSSSLDELTVKRDACRRAGAALAYTARLLRAELEVLEAEVEWRSYRLDRQLTRLAESIAAAVTDDTGGASSGLESLDTETPLAGFDLLSGSSGASDDIKLAATTAARVQSDKELARRAEVVRSCAESTRARRTALRNSVDRLEFEIAARYSAGEADTVAFERGGATGTDEDSGDDG